ALFSNNVKTMIVSGDVDVATCPFAGTQYAIQALNRTVVNNWRAWTVDTAAGAGQVAGYVTEYDTYTFATVKAAGHGAPGFQPLESYQLMHTFITGGTLPSATAPVAGKPVRRSQGSVLRERIAAARQARRA